MGVIVVLIEWSRKKMPIGHEYEDDNDGGK